MAYIGTRYGLYWKNSKQICQEKIPNPAFQNSISSVSEVLKSRIHSPETGRHLQKKAARASRNWCPDGTRRSVVRLSQKPGRLCVRTAGRRHFPLLPRRPSQTQKGSRCPERAGMASPERLGRPGRRAAGQHGSPPTPICC